MSHFLLLLAVLALYGTAEGFGQRDQVLADYEHVYRSLVNGGEVQVVFDFDACELDVSQYERVAVSIPLDIWQWFDIAGEARIAFSTTFLTPRPSPTPVFIKITGGLRTNDEFSFTVETIEPPTWTTLEKFDFICSVGSGAQFFLRQGTDKRVRLSTFNEVKASLLTGVAVSRVANYTNCVEPPPFSTVSGGPVSLHYAIEEGTEDEFMKIIDTVLVGNMVEGSPYAINSNHMNIHVNDSVKVNPAMWDTVEWDNDYFRPEGYVCDVGIPGIEFLASSESPANNVGLTTVGEIQAALQAGRKLRYEVFADACTSNLGGSTNAILSDWVDFWRIQNGPGAGERQVRFTSYHYTEAGLLHTEEYTISEDSQNDIFVIMVTQTDPATSAPINEEILDCDLGSSAVIWTSDSEEPTQRTDFTGIEEALLAGEHLTIVADLGACDEQRAEAWSGFSSKSPILIREPEGDDQLFTSTYRYMGGAFQAIDNVALNIFATGTAILTEAVYESTGFMEVSGGPTERRCTINDGNTGAIRVYTTH